MKNCFLCILCFLFFGVSAFAQDDDKKSFSGNFYAGGSISAAFANNVFGIGVNPEFGYNLARWADVGIVVNYNYTSYRYYGGITSDDKLRQTIYGAGLYTRLFPVKFLFAQGQIEHNWIVQKQLYSGGSVKDKFGSNSVLIGAGYTTGRNPDSQSAYGYFSILVDILNEANSPYVGYDYDINGNVIGRHVVPVIRAGFIVPLFKRSGNR